MLQHQVNRFLTPVVSRASSLEAATHVPRLTKLLATPPKEPRKDLPRRAASQDRGEETAGVEAETAGCSPWGP